MATTTLNTLENNSTHWIKTTPTFESRKLDYSLTQSELKIDKIFGSVEEARKKRLNEEIDSELKKGASVSIENRMRISMLQEFLVEDINPDSISFFSTDSNSLFFNSKLSENENLHLELYLDNSEENLFFNYILDKKSTKNGIGSFNNVIHYLKQTFKTSYRTI